AKQGQPRAEPARVLILEEQPAVDEPTNLTRLDLDGDAVERVAAQVGGRLGHLVAVADRPNATRRLPDIRLKHQPAVADVAFRELALVRVDREAELAGQRVVEEQKLLLGAD